MIRKLAALVLVPLAAGCNTARPRRGEEGAPRAVVLCAPDRKVEAEAIARALNASYGYEVLLKVTTIRRAKSSVAVYGLHDQPGRLDEISDLLRDLGIGALESPGAIEVLPFPQHATGGNAAVFWLSAGEAESIGSSNGTAQSLDASSPATSR